MQVKRLLERGEEKEPGLPQFLHGKSFNFKLSGNDVYYTA
jgi:hypothetical protein